MVSTYKINDKTFKIDDGRDYTETYNAPEHTTAALAYQFFEDLDNDIKSKKAFEGNGAPSEPAEKKSYFIKSYFILHNRKGNLVDDALLKFDPKKTVLF